MLSCVFFHGKDFKILKSIIRLDSISVVNVFALKQTSSKILSHDNTVLKFELFSDSDCNVAVTSDKASGVGMLFPASH